MDRRSLVVLCVLAGGLGAAGSASEAGAFACGQIPATRVFDVQWNGDENQTDQACSYFQMPYDPRTHSRLQVDVHDDYFELVLKEGGYALQQFDERGTLKFELSGGEVKLANADVVFYIIDGFYGTIITRSSSYSYGDAANFTGLTRDPALSCIPTAPTTTIPDGVVLEVSLSAQAVASVAAHAMALVALIANMWISSS